MEMILSLQKLTHESKSFEAAFDSTESNGCSSESNYNCTNTIEAGF